MSTNNFSYKNVLVACPDFKIDYDNEFDEYVSNIQEQLKKIGFEACDKWDYDRNYPGKIIASYGLEDGEPCGMIKYLEVVIRSGYYDGCNIDWTSDGEFSSEDESNKKECKKINSLNKKFDIMVKKTEKILRKNGTELLRVGVFSNGEAVYEIKKRNKNKIAKITL